MVANRNILIVFIITFVFISCKLDQELDIRDMGASPGYFIECYCIPNEMFNLTATRIAPIAEDQYLDYSLEFDMYITTHEPVKLYHSLFNTPGSKFVYNYASNKRLDKGLTDSIRLDATAPDGSLITASTKIPDNVKIDTTIWTERQLYISYTTSPDPAQNFYILRTDFFKGGEIKFRDMEYQTYGKGSRIIEHYTDLPSSFAADSIVIHLKRFTEEGYKYQLSLRDAIESNKDQLVFPTPLYSNIKGAIGIFTCYTIHRITLK